MEVRMNKDEAQLVIDSIKNAIHVKRIHISSNTRVIDSGVLSDDSIVSIKMENEKFFNEIDVLDTVMNRIANELVKEGK